jgi:hypothetical protein
VLDILLKDMKIKSTLLILLVASLLFVGFAVQSPDQDLHFTREIISDLPPERLDRNLSSLSRWPQWFHSLTQANVVSSQSQLGSALQTGDVLKLNIDPKKGMSKAFELTARVTEYKPGQKISLAILDDSTGRLTRIFDKVIWTIELKSHPKGTLIFGEATAHTCHWRSRLLGKMAEKILLNQIFYPNLIQLAQLRQPFSVEAPPQGYGMGTP